MLPYVTNFVTGTKFSYVHLVFMYIFPLIFYKHWIKEIARFIVHTFNSIYMFLFPFIIPNCVVKEGTTIQSKQASIWSIKLLTWQTDNYGEKLCHIVIHLTQLDSQGHQCLKILFQTKFFNSSKQSSIHKFWLKDAYKYCFARSWLSFGTICAYVQVPKS